jgi:PAS domain S-box-containing protein
MINMINEMKETGSGASRQEMLERISDLEEEIRNLLRLHQTIERNTGLFEALIAAGREGICLSRLDGSLIRIVKPILGYTGPALNGVSIFDLVHGDDREALREIYGQITSGAERSVVVEARMIQPDGSWARVQDRITDMLDNPAVHAVVHNYQNVTELRAGELAAAELQAVMRHAPFAMFSKSVEGEILSWKRRRAGDVRV